MRDTRAPIEPRIDVMIASDQEGLFGRVCPECKAYFRTSAPDRYHWCPYCLHRDHNREFTTPAQALFIKAYCKAALESLNSGEEVEVDLDRLREEAPDGASQWKYAEEKQQTRIKCAKCQTVFDILGDYGSCTSCGQRNSHAAFGARIDEMEQRFVIAEEQLKDRSKREEEWERLLRCVSEFESLANDLRKLLVMLPLTPKRRRELERLSFQRILNASESLQAWFAIDMLDGISAEDRTFLNVMFNRRHVFTHNGGRVDAEYLQNTGDTKVRLHERLRLRSNEIRRLLPLIKKAGKALIDGVESIA